VVRTQRLLKASTLPSHSEKEFSADGLLTRTKSSVVKVSFDALVPVSVVVVWDDGSLRMRS